MAESIENAERLLLAIACEDNPWVGAVPDAFIDEALAVATASERVSKSDGRSAASPSSAQRHVITTTTTDAELADFAVAQANADADATASGLPIDAATHEEEPFLSFVDSSVVALSAQTPILECYALPSTEGASDAVIDSQIAFAIATEQPAPPKTRSFVRTDTYAKPSPPAHPIDSEFEKQAALNREQLAETVMSERHFGEEPSKSLVHAVLRQAEEDMDPKGTAFVGEMYQHILPSGAIGGEEILDRLLGEARRIQWERAASDAAEPTTSKSKPTPRKPTLVQRLRALASRRRVTGMPPLTASEQEMLAGVYASIRESGAADTDGILEVLLGEALKIVEPRTVKIQPKL